ncbi:MAG: TRAP transporter large permease [Patulibacter sp.]|nr:TRAP transporter large permease [Patulibacter sp.]
MDSMLMVLIALGVFLFILAAEMPVAVGLAAAGVTGLLLDNGFEQTAATLSSAAYQATSTYTLIVIPMFILMGVLVANAGVLGNVFDLAARATRKLPGGLGIATVLSAAGFSAVTGSSAAAVATLGRLCVGEMRRHGYTVKFAASIVAASGTLGVLIPPSIVLVIYGVITNESVSQLLLAAIIPGLITAIAYILTIVLIASLGNREKHIDSDHDGSGHRDDAPAGSRAATRDVAVAMQANEEEVDRPVDVDFELEAGPGGIAMAKPTRAQRLQELESVFYIGIIFVVVLGGIYGGIFTETEAGAVGALVAVLVLLLRSGRTELGLKKSLTSALRETSANTSMLFALLIGGSIFTLFLVTARVPQELTDWIVGLDVNKYVVVAIILLVLLILGALLDGMSILLLTMPLTYPVITDLGFSGLWYGILAVKMVEIGLLTPPFGLNVFLVSGVVKEAKVEDVFRGVLPFIFAELCVVLLIVLVPELVTWLPDLASANK